MGRAWVISLVGLLACGDDESTAPEKGGVVCAAWERANPDGGCLVPGQQDNGCGAGEWLVEGVGCEAAGVPESLCAMGFAPDGRRGCNAILPAQPCESGTLALPGETRCRLVTECGAGPWGAIPMEAGTQFVDGSYAGLDSDGSEARPWVTIQEAIDVAAPGALVAIAAGTYIEDLQVTGKAVRIWGRCPGLVELRGAGTALGALLVGAGASGTMVRNIAVRGPQVGLVASGAEQVIVEEVWFHDIGFAMVIQNDFGPTAVELRSSLIERAGNMGVFVAGARTSIVGTVIRGLSARGLEAQHRGGERASVAITGSVIENHTELALFASGSDATIEGSVLRATFAGGQQRAISAQDDPTAGFRANVAVVASVIELSRYNGIFAHGSDVALDASVVRGTTPLVGDVDSVGIQMEGEPGARGKLELRASVVEANHGIGVFGEATDLMLERTIVRDTQPWDAIWGRGIETHADSQNGERSTLTCRGAVIEHNHEAGVTVSGADATIEGTIVRGTIPDVATQRFGRGIVLQDHALGGPSNIALRASLVADNHDLAIFVAGSQASIEDSFIGPTYAEVATGRFGRGIELQETSLRASGTIHRCIVSESRDTGIIVIGADATIDATLIRATRGQQGDGSFGDGLLVASSTLSPPATARIHGSVIETNARAGIANFGSFVELGTSKLECNLIDLNAETFNALPPEFQDLGENACGCAGSPAECAARSSKLTAPGQSEQ